MPNDQTTDLPARLRAQAADYGPDWRGKGMAGLLTEAAGEVERLRKALHEIDQLFQRPGGAGQIARDALRVQP